ncbi:MAG: hypothetical protein KJO95_02205 [Gammaproteobacteria bacterium]|nr:hypothetical protein [Gammaproteobacteria bacterium]MBU2676094.1 hypothetical protein [Gammaproteobacteria bacterium]NNC56332.1 hypothetical protein [Woeseiaceae bacterium]NNL49830.1 hypothetical protein [Woeseiaceae bacterium]
MSDTSSTLKKTIRKEGALFVFLLFIGLVIMPIAAYWVGQAIFGEYGGHGYGDFFGILSEKIRSGDRVAWFLILSPYLIWQCLRLMLFGWRYAGKTA